MSPYAAIFRKQRSLCFRENTPLPPERGRRPPQRPDNSVTLSLALFGGDLGQEVCLKKRPKVRKSALFLKKDGKTRFVASNQIASSDIIIYFDKNDGCIMLSSVLSAFWALRSGFFHHAIHDGTNS